MISKNPKKFARYFRKLSVLVRLGYIDENFPIFLVFDPDPVFKRIVSAALHRYRSDNIPTSLLFGSKKDYSVRHYWRKELFECIKSENHCCYLGCYHNHFTINALREIIKNF